MPDPDYPLIVNNKLNKFMSVIKAGNPGLPQRYNSEVKLEESYFSQIILEENPLLKIIFNNSGILMTILAEVCLIYALKSAKNSFSATNYLYPVYNYLYCTGLKYYQKENEIKLPVSKTVSKIIDGGVFTKILLTAIIQL